MMPKSLTRKNSAPIYTMTPTVLITRPEEEYADTAAMVQALGYEPLACPMLRIEPVQVDFSDVEAHPQGFAALVFTSVSALPPFCVQCGVRDLPVYTVGDVTAERARQAGFTQVISAAGDIAALEAVLRAAMLPPDKPLLHLSGADVVRPLDLPGLRVDRRVVYRAVQAESLPEDAQMHIRAHSPRLVLFYSARTAQAFAAAIKKDRLAHQLMSSKALCLSESMVESLRDLPWRSIAVAPRPDRAGMQSLLAEEQGLDTVMNSYVEPQNNEDQDAITPAEPVIERFGGIRPMATKMGVPVTTVQGWKKRNVIPGNRRDDVMQAATRHHIDLQNILNKAGTAPVIESVMDAAHAVDQRRVTQSARENANDASPRADLDQIMANIKQSERRAVKKSAAITVTVVSAVALAAAVLLGPGVRGTFQQEAASQADVEGEVQALRDDVARLDADVNGVKEEQFALKNLIPADLGTTLEGLKGNVSALGTQMGAQMGTIRESAQVAAAGIATDVMGPQAGDMAARVAALQTHGQTFAQSVNLSDLLKRLGQWKQTPEGTQKIDQSHQQLADILKNLNGDDAALEAQLKAAQEQPGTPLSETLAGVPQSDLKAAAMLLALTQFRTSLHRNAPFDEDLATMREMVGKDDPELQAAIDRLAPQASKGVLSPQGLSDELKGLTGDIVVSSIKGEDVSIREKALARMNDVFQVQKDGELVTGTDTQARIARAQKLLDEGKVDDAVKELQELQGPARETAQPLIDEALMTSLAQQVSSALTGKVAAQLPDDATATNPLSGLLDSLSGLSPEELGSTLGQTVKGTSKKAHAPYTTGGAGLDGIMGTMDSLGLPGTEGASEPIYMPQQ